mmetsp:Transcript_9927/g.28428  ORF Transcript_9927/g.28428 Transcript_9927/m.28428 type:complete len:230 (+) Transcript_9927:923-1612(+)
MRMLLCLCKWKCTAILTLYIACSQVFHDLLPCGLRRWDLYALSLRHQREEDVLLDEKFLPFTASRRSAQTHVVLLLDNSSGQVHPDILQTAKDNHVIMVGLPPHITHITRALGVSLMKPRKDYWTAGIEEAVQSMKKPFEKYTEEDVITLLCTYLCTWEEGGWIILEPILQCHDTLSIIRHAWVRTREEAPTPATVSTRESRLSKRSHHRLLQRNELESMAMEGRKPLC